MSDNPFNGQQYLNLETYRKNGDPVHTPVWFVQTGDLFYFRTLSDSGKIKRLRRKPQVRIAPCKVDGTLLGEWRNAEWVLLEETQMDDLLTRYNQKYAAEIAAITSRDMRSKLRANQGFALRLR
jgi:PPOX class probable F420-dependent enzyme